MTDNYHRLVEVIAGPCPSVLSATMYKYAQMDDPAFTSMAKYMEKNKSVVTRLHRQRKLTKFQYDMVTSGQSDVKWDVSLWAALLIGFYGNTRTRKLTVHEKVAIESIRTQRNNLQHKATSGDIDEKSFNAIWASLETQLIRLASQSNRHDFPTKVKEKLETIKTMTVSTSHEELRTWYTTCLDISTERNCKRLKSENIEMERLREEFSSTLRRQQMDSFTPGQECLELQEMLKQNRSIVVTGHGNNFHLKVALSAIKKCFKNPKSRVELVRTLDWNSVDRKLTNIVLCQNPFGEFEFDAKLAKEYITIFNNIQKAIDDQHFRINLVIVSRKDVLNKAKEYGIVHKLLETEKVIGSSSEDPVDLTTELASCSDDPELRLILDRTKLYLGKKVGLDIKEDALNNAKTKLMHRKWVVLSSHDELAVQAMAISIADSYKHARYIVLRTPDEFRHLPRENFVLVVVVDAFGKDTLDMNKTRRWMDRFADFQLFANDCKIYTIITTNTSVLCQLETQEKEMKLPGPEVWITEDDIIVVVKDEMSSEDDNVDDDDGEVGHDTSNSRQNGFSFDNSLGVYNNFMPSFDKRVSETGARSGEEIAGCDESETLQTSDRGETLNGVHTYRTRRQLSESSQTTHVSETSSSDIPSDAETVCNFPRLRTDGTSQLRMNFKKTSDLHLPTLWSKRTDMEELCSDAIESSESEESEIFEDPFPRAMLSHRRSENRTDDSKVSRWIVKEF